MKRYYFFKLTDPRNPNLVRYVGSTTENLSIRLSKMISEVRNTDKTTNTAIWIRELFDFGMRPLIDMIEISGLMTEEQANSRQAELIENYQLLSQADLNMTKGRGTQGFSNPKDEETKKKISEALVTVNDQMITDGVKMRLNGNPWKAIYDAWGMSKTNFYKTYKEKIDHIVSSGLLDN